MQNLRFPTLIPLLLGVIFMLVGLLFIDILAADQQHLTGVVLDKQYQASQTSTGAGTGITSGGNVVVVQQTESSPEEFLLIVKAQDGSICTVKCSPEVYYDSELGKNLSFHRNIGYLSGITWGYASNE